MKQRRPPAKRRNTVPNGATARLDALEKRVELLERVIADLIQPEMPEEPQAPAFYGGPDAQGVTSDAATQP